MTRNPGCSPDNLAIVKSAPPWFPLERDHNLWPKIFSTPMESFFLDLDRTWFHPNTYSWYFYARRDRLLCKMFSFWRRRKTYIFPKHNHKALSNRIFVWL